MDWRESGGGSSTWLEPTKYQEMVRELSLLSRRRRRQRRDLIFADNYPMGGDREYESGPFWEVQGERIKHSTGNSV